MTHYQAPTRGHEIPEDVIVITVYSKPGCVQCTATYRALHKQGLPYETRDVTGDDAAYKRVQDLGYQQVPVVEAGDKHWSGFRPDKIKALSAASHQPDAATITATAAAAAPSATR